MTDIFTTRTTTGYGSRIMNSIVGALVGVVLFVGSFGVLYWNEGRADMSKVAKKAVEISAEQKESTVAPGTLVAATGKLTSSQKLGDSFTTPGGEVKLLAKDYATIKRTAEMYAWVEHKKEKTVKNTGGSETTETTYEYTKEWTTDPKSSADFAHPEDHENPVPSVASDQVTAADLSVGVYGVDPTSVELPAPTALKLTKENIFIPTKLILSSGGEYVMLGTAATSSPKVGDVRVSYAAVPTNGQVLIFGVLTDTKITPYFDSKQNKLYRVFTGTKQEALQTLHSEYLMWLWIVRLVGFLMMWFGMFSFFGPLTTVLDVLPFMGSIGRGLIGVVLFVVALALSAVTIIVSAILHNIIALVVVAVLGVGVLVWWIKRIKANKMPTAQKA